MASRRPAAPEPGSPWTRAEVEALVADYLDMFARELAGERFNKAAHSRELHRQLPARRKQSIEFKHANVSAVLVELGFRYIDGYKPRANFQGMLRDVVQLRLAERPDIVRLMSEVADMAEPLPSRNEDRLLTLVPTPHAEPLLRKVGETFVRAPSVGHPDFLRREAANTSLGLAGELAVLRFEHHRLWTAGKRRLADAIDHVSQTKGDGLGYDIHSFEASGADRLIEVKTTRGGVAIPFFVTRNEVIVSQARDKEYHLYRAFDFSRSRQLYTVRGALPETCVLEPIAYRAVPR